LCWGADDLFQEELVHEYGAYFEGKTKEELDELARSFALGQHLFDHCLGACAKVKSQ
jgi:hypothetical protein